MKRWFEEKRLVMEQPQLAEGDAESLRVRVATPWREGTAHGTSRKLELFLGLPPTQLPRAHVADHIWSVAGPRRGILSDWQESSPRIRTQQSSLFIISWVSAARFSLAHDASGPH